MDGPRGWADGAGEAITTWVEATFAPMTIDGVTVYDLTAGTQA